LEPYGEPVESSLTGRRLKACAAGTWLLILLRADRRQCNSLTGPRLEN
jgi:hypothetical protein